MNADIHYTLNDAAIERLFGKQEDDQKLKLYSALIGLSNEIIEPPSRESKVAITIGALKTFKKDLPYTRKQVFNVLRENKIYLERKGNARKTTIATNKDHNR